MASERRSNSRGPEVLKYRALLVAGALAVTPLSSTSLALREARRIRARRLSLGTTNAFGSRSKVTGQFARVVSQRLIAYHHR